MFDGPYIRKHPSLANQWQSFMPDKSGVLTSTLPDSQPTFCSPATLHTHHTPVISVEFDQVEKFAALSDVHGQYQTVIELLTRHQIIDAQQNWCYGKGHLVMLGDIFDRGDGVIRIFWLLYKLQAQAQLAGGKVHCLLGNHEFMIMRKSWRYLAQHYQDFASELGLEYHDLFNKDWVLGSWMRQWPTMIRLNKSLFVHGGLSPSFLAHQLTMQEVNDRARQAFGIEREAVFAHPLYGCIHDLDGPFWYRGYFKPNSGLTEQDVQAGLTQYGAERVIVGHTPQQHIRSRFNGKVIGVDSGIQLAGRGEILLYQQGQFSTGNLAGEQSPLQAVDQPNDLDTD
ncbi:metallophosphoesterase [Salinibius halmophilus]|uniref:metallophosphoesterase n=1 Tax=Salinibius halmophilus TaxID=1853216 RepID=UPI000E66F56E|nr:metallophosphoesterase [Salinibius halmophilus]